MADRYRLRNMRVKRVALVANPASQDKGTGFGAFVALYKAADSKKKPVDMECPKCGAEMGKADKFCAKCGAEMKASKEMEHMTEDEAKKLKDDADAALKLAQEAENRRSALEKSLKDQSDAIAELKKQLDESDARVKKAEAEAKLATFRKTVDAFEHLPVKADTFAPILMKCAESLDDKEYAEFMRVLKAADAASADNFVEIGAPGRDAEPQSATAELERKAEELRKSNAKLSETDAYIEAAKRNPKLAERARKESYARSDN